MISSESLGARVPNSLSGCRLDQALARMFPEFSRSRLQTWIRGGRVQVDGQPLRPRDRVAGGELVRLDFEPEALTNCEPEDLPLDIIFEDDSLIVVNKPAGLVVHPAAGNWCGTLQNALLNHDPELASLPRAGLVHRIDKDTTGLLVIARTLRAHKVLVDQLQARTIQREYFAIVYGTMPAGGTVDEPIARHPVDRRKYAVHESGRVAVTHFRIAERLSHHTLIRVSLETGRTHQIRVHMAHLRYPIVGDPVYGGRFRIPAGCTQDLIERLQQFRRQALHAARLGLEHPVTGRYCEWHVEMPEDLGALLEVLRKL
ncbi:MAG: 23S rRNA pseudouridine(1911/1915/1917) synthase RluD [Methylococcaceae bacterium]|nr:23S rRNA pseudouridine(1911/1915/1917) synthase RluD [Methylococcaceae bacterium]